MSCSPWGCKESDSTERLTKGLLGSFFFFSAVILEPTKIKSDTVSTVSPSISHEVVGPDAKTYI